MKHGVLKGMQKMQLMRKGERRREKSDARRETVEVEEVCAYYSSKDMTTQLRFSFTSFLFYCQD